MGTLFLIKESIMINPFAALVASKIKLLARPFFHTTPHAYLRELAKEFNVSTNSVCEKLNQLTKTNLLKSKRNGWQVFFAINLEHPLFPESKSMVSKAMGIDQVIESIVCNRLDHLERAYLYK
jgi:hypothetical protein